ncbi:MAG: hypothetical protein H6600_01630 [Flavobacteriales bacterium]|nr:hypothetical protein [Flavobacteriales bacterium]
MKKNLPLIILSVILILGGIYALFLIKSENTISDEPLSDFNIKDTANVTKIKITEKDLGDITLIRKGTEWIIESTGEKAQPYNVNLILETAYQIQVKQTVSEVAKENVIQQLSIRHKKVEFFFNGEEEAQKIWFVGSPTNDHMGTFMLLEVKDPTTGAYVRSPEPFIMHKPGVYGTLDTRFFTSINDWKFPGVFIYKPGQIANITVQNFKHPEESYSVDVTDHGKVILKDGAGNLVQAYDSSAVKHIVSLYTDIYYESDATHLTQEQQDSVLTTTPIFNLTVTDINGKKTEARVWDNFNQTEGGGLALDIGRALCSVNGSKHLVRVQYYTWDVLMKPLSFFIPSKEVNFQFN